MKKVLFAILTLGLAVMLCGCGTQTVDLNELFSYEVSGYDGSGMVTKKIDKNRLDEEIVEITGRSALDMLGDLYKVEQAVSAKGSWDKEADLSNGDIITYSWNVDTDILKDKYGIVLKCENVKVKVEGLEGLKEADPFENINIAVEGAAPYGSIKISGGNPDIVSSDGRGITFKAEPESGLKNGDEVTIRLIDYWNENSDVADMCNKRGIEPTRLEMKYTVEGMDEYIQSEADLPEGGLDIIKKDAEDRIHADMAQNLTEGEKMEKLEYIGDIVLSEKYTNSNSYANRIYLVYKITMKKQ